jgi:hypothetical protein
MWRGRRLLLGALWLIGLMCCSGLMIESCSLGIWMRMYCLSWILEKCSSGLYLRKIGKIIVSLSCCSGLIESCLTGFEMTTSKLSMMYCSKLTIENCSSGLYSHSSPKSTMMS